MKNLKQSGAWTAGAMLAAMMAATASAQTASTQTTGAQTTPQREIVVSLVDHKLALMEDGRVVHVYPVAVGKPSTPSPVGTFTILHRVEDPTYYHHGKVIAPGPGNPVGDRWMSLSIPGYGIHGTNDPRSIGKAASHGCIRMARRDIEDLFSRVRVGDTVVLIGQRDEETAQIFGDAPVQAAPARQPALLVKAEPAPALQPVQTQVQVVKVDAPQPVAAAEPASAAAADNTSLMARNTSAPAADLSATGSW